MIDYVDPIPAVRRFLDQQFEGRFNVYGNLFPSNPALPAMVVRTAGGASGFRLQLISRGNDDIAAMRNLIDAMNFLERYAQNVQGIRVLWCERESNPIPAVDEDTGKPEAWCYMNLEALES